MLWVDKYRPQELRALDFHADVTKRLTNLAASDDLPHLLVYGPSGAGKKTRIMALLRELYGDGALKVRLEHKSFKVRHSSYYKCACVRSCVAADARAVAGDACRQQASRRKWTLRPSRATTTLR